MPTAEKGNMFNPDRIEFLDFQSEALRDNPLGDPSRRLLAVYLPPNYHSSPEKRYPVLWCLSGFTGSGPQNLYSRFLHPGLHYELDELIWKQGMPPVIVAFPDCITKLGGSQYVNSTATGNYDDYITRELVPLMDERYQTNGRHGLFGGSSGGIGSFTLAAKHPEVFHAFADHSGDSGFESCYLNDIPKVVQAMARYDYDIENFMNSIGTVSHHDDGAVLNFVGMASCYGANPDAKLGFEMPFDLYTGKVDWDKWAKWQEHDPVNMVEPYADNLRQLLFRYVDCGIQDQFHLYLGARQLHQKLEEFEIEHVYEEYDSDHFKLRRAQEKKSIPMLAKALSAI